MTELAKTFEPGPIEARWYAHWEGQGLFRPARNDAERLFHLEAGVLDELAHALRFVRHPARCVL